MLILLFDNVALAKTLNKKKASKIFVNQVNTILDQIEGMIVAGNLFDAEFAVTRIEEAVKYKSKKYMIQEDLKTALRKCKQGVLKKNRSVYEFLGATSSSKLGRVKRVKRISTAAAVTCGNGDIATCKNTTRLLLSEFYKVYDLMMANRKGKYKRIFMNLFPVSTVRWMAIVLFDLKEYKRMVQLKEKNDYIETI